ncbi:MAG: hypothetical protein HC862_24315 [Scytonema sp. RU_4_4]|nr:hypothetical protein [Scytonema sp. RU_4_4]
MPATISDIIVQFVGNADRDQMHAIKKRYGLTLIDAREEPLAYVYEVETDNLAQLCNELANEDYVLVANSPHLFTDHSRENMPKTSDLIIQFVETVDRDQMQAIAKRYGLTLVDAREEPLAYLYEIETDNLAQLCNEIGKEDDVLVVQAAD